METNNLFKIIDKLYISTNEAAEDIEVIKSKGITHLVNIGNYLEV